MMHKKKERCYLHIGMTVGLILGVASGIVLDYLGMSVFLGLMFGGAVGGLIDGEKGC